MEARYPQLKFRGIAGTIARFRGPITPIGPFSHDVEYLLDDIAHSRDIRAYDGGQLTHFTDCAVRHCRHEWMDAARNFGTEFVVRVEIIPDGSDPRCFVESPQITKPKHMWRDGSICPFLSSVSAWDPAVHTVADFMPDVSVWLLKRMVYDQTGVWIGREHDHARAYYVLMLKSSDRCWCRSGNEYGICHQAEDRMLAARGL